MADRTIHCVGCGEDLPRPRFPTSEQARHDAGLPATCIDCVRKRKRETDLDTDDRAQYNRSF